MTIWSIGVMEQWNVARKIVPKKFGIFISIFAYGAEKNDDSRKACPEFNRRNAKHAK
jgi:hypothetical protein